MAITMEPNHVRDHSRELLYIPTLVDSSIPGILAHRGVPAKRIMKLIADLDSPCTMARIEMLQLLPCEESHRVQSVPYEHVFNVVLTGTARWTGSCLTMRHTLPATVLNGIKGRGLREIVDHPALPNRTILSATQQDDNLIILVKGDPQPVVKLSGATNAVLRGSPARNAQRRKWIVSQLDRPNSDSEWCDFLEELRKRAVSDFLNGTVHQYGPLCWGEPPRLTDRFSFERWFGKSTEKPISRAA